MAFSQRMAVLTAVGAIPPGVAATSYALTDGPEEPDPPARVEMEGGRSSAPGSAPASPERTPGDDLDARLAAADLVITAEGALDRQPPRGKVPAEVARRARLHGRPVLALAGALGEGAHDPRHGSRRLRHRRPGPDGAAEALLRARDFLADAAGRALRMVLLGRALAGRPAAGSGNAR